MPVKKKLDIPMNILVTAPVKNALQRIANENMISVSDIVRSAINVAVPVQFEKYTEYLAEEQEKFKVDKDIEKTLRQIESNGKLLKKFNRGE